MSDHDILLSGLKADGFALIPGLLSTDAVEELRSICDRLPAGAGGNQRDEELEGHPAVVTLLRAELLARALRMLMSNVPPRPMVAARMPRHGHGQQGLHCDVASREARGVTTLVYLDDADATNGGTRIVPGTHLRRTAPPRQLADPASHHPKERIVTTSAGSALIFDAHLWHSGTRNQTGRPRRALQITWR
jgi:Phytanoyl-CoA dioxygenase (PhyH)